MIEEALFFDPGARNEQAFVEIAEGPAVVLEIDGNFREVASEERFSQAEWFKKGEPEALGDGSGDEVAAVRKPAGVGVLEAGVRGFASDHAQFDRKMKLLHGVGPLIVDRAPLGIIGWEGEREAGAGRGESREETELPEVFATNATHRIQNKRMVIGGSLRELGHGGRGDGVGQEGSLLFGHARVDEEGAVAGVDEGVANLRSEGIDLSVVAEELVVSGTAVFGEVVEMEDELFLGARQLLDEGREEGVLPQGGVVEVPDCWVTAEGDSGGAAKFSGERFLGLGAGLAGIVESGDHGDGKVAWSLIRRSGENDV